MRNKSYIYLPALLSLGIVIASCTENSVGGSDSVSSVNKANVLAAGCTCSGLFNKPLRVQIEEVKFLTKGAKRGISAYLICKNGDAIDITSDAKTNWSSNDYNVIEVDNKNYKGQVSAINKGQAKLKVVYDKMNPATQEVDVISSYCGANTQMIGTHVEPAKFDSLPVGGTEELKVYAECANSTQVDVTAFTTWSSTSKQTLQVNDDTHKGLVTGINKGKANVIALLDNQKIYDHSVAVDGALLTSLSVHGEDIIAAGLSSKLTVIGKYADGTSADVTGITTYSVLHGDVSVDASGVIKGDKPGKFEIQLILNGKTAFFKGEVTDAKVVSFAVTNADEINFTPYIATQATIKGVVKYSDGTTRVIPKGDLQCSIAENQTNIIQTQEQGCTFAQLGEKDSSVNIEVRYNQMLSLPAVNVTAHLIASEISKINLAANNQNFHMVSESLPYSVSITLKNGKTIDITKQIPLVINDKSREFGVNEQVLFDEDKGVLVLNKPITEMDPVRVYAQIGDLKSNEILFNKVYTNEYSEAQINEILLNVFRNEITQKIAEGNWKGLSFANNSATTEVIEAPAQVKGLFTDKDALVLINLNSNQKDRAKSLFNRMIDYDDKDPNYKFQVKMQMNPNNRSSVVVLSEFCNNTNVSVPFSTASLSRAFTDGYSWGLSEKLGFSTAAKGGANILGLKGEVTQTISVEVGGNQNWTKSTTDTFSMGGANPTLPPHQHAIVVSTIHNLDYYYSGKVPLKLTKDYPVTFYVNNPKTHVGTVGYVTLGSIYSAGKSQILDKLFEVSSGKLYMDYNLNVISTGNNNDRSVTHSIYWVDDNGSTTLPCIYPQGGNATAKPHLAAYRLDELTQLKHKRGYEFLERSPDVLSTQK